MKLLLFATRVPLCLLLMLATGAMAAMSSGYTHAMFIRAVHEQSTAPLFVLITVRNAKTGESKQTCTLAPFLLGAVEVENHLGGASDSEKKLRNIVMRQTDHVFTLRSAAAIQRLNRQYTSQQLAESREYINKLNQSELKAQIRSNGSPLHRFYYDRSLTQVERYEYSLAHALLERGVLVGVADRSGSLYLP